MSPQGFARRFIAGESVEEAVEAVHPIAERGLLLTLDYLGESVTTSEEADAATRDYIRILKTIVRSGIERNVSAQTDAAWPRRRSRHRGGQPAPYSRRPPPSMGSSCASTWRTRLIPTSRCRFSKRCGAGAPQHRRGAAIDAEANARRSARVSPSWARACGWSRAPTWSPKPSPIQKKTRSTRHMSDS